MAFCAVDLNVVIGRFGTLSEGLLRIAVLQFVLLVEIGGLAVICSIRQSFDKTWGHGCGDST